MSENNIVGMYLESQMITTVIKSEQKTPLGADIIEVTTADGRKRLIPEATLEAIATKDPIDASEFRDRRVRFICTKIIDIIAEYDLHISDWEYVVQVIQSSINISYQKAQEVLWKTPEKTMLDIDRVIKGVKVTMDDILKKQ